MDIKEFEKYTKNLEAYSASEVRDFEFMTDKELEAYQNNLEEDGGDNLSCWEHIRHLFTMKKMIAELNEKLWYLNQIEKE